MRPSVIRPRVIVSREMIETMVPLVSLHAGDTAVYDAGINLVKMNSYTVEGNPLDQ
jgi:hypothetical protein